MTKGTACIV